MILFNRHIFNIILLGGWFWVFIAYIWATFRIGLTNSLSNFPCCWKKYARFAHFWFRWIPQPSHDTESSSQTVKLGFCSLGAEPISWLIFLFPFRNVFKSSDLIKNSVLIESKWDSQIFVFTWWLWWNQHCLGWF